MAPSFLDKARAAAQQAIDEAKKGIDTGQAKLDEAAAKREGEKLLAALGAAFYAEQRRDGNREAVNTALNAVDAHVTEHGWVGVSDAATAAPAAGAANSSPGPDAQPPPPPPPPPPAPPTSPPQQL